MASTISCRKCGAPAKYVGSDRRGDIHHCTECTNSRGKPTTTYYDADYREKHGKGKGSLDLDDVLYADDDRLPLFDEINQLRGTDRDQEDAY